LFTAETLSPATVAAEALELLRVSEELDDLLEFLLRLVDAGDILEGDAPDLLGQQLGARLPEAHRSPAAGLHLAHEEDPEPQHDEEGQPGDDRGDEDVGRLLLRAGLDAHVLVAQAVDKRRVGRGVGHEAAAILEHARDARPLDLHGADIAAVDLGDEVRVGDGLRGTARRTALEDAVERHQEDDHDDPEGQVLADVVHG